MIQWEYTEISDAEGVLKMAGEQGWELVQVVIEPYPPLIAPGEFRRSYILKRQTNV